MMKTIKLFLIVACVTILYSCQQTPSFTIAGTVDKPGLEGKKVFFLIGDWASSEHKMDSTVILDGKYSFQGIAEEVNNASIILNPNDRENAVWINLALENARITINTDADGWSIVSGTVDNERFQEFKNAKRPHEKRFYKAYEVYSAAENAGTLTSEDEEKINEERGIYRNTVGILTFEFVKNNINNPAAWSELHNCAISLPIEKQKELIAGANERTLKTSNVKEIQERIRILEKTAIGQPFTDFRMNTPEGKEVALSDYVGKGKCILIDFWASWCGPCRAEMPNVVAAYEKYKNKGFEIVGVSLDMKHDSWVKAIEELKLPWVHMSDLKGWGCEGCKLYAVTGVPSTVLLDKEGVIIARNIRGEELQAKLAELMEKK